MSARDDFSRIAAACSQHLSGCRCEWCRCLSEVDRLREVETDYAVMEREYADCEAKLRTSQREVEWLKGLTSGQNQVMCDIVETGTRIDQENKELRRLAEAVKVWRQNVVVAPGSRYSSQLVQAFDAWASTQTDPPEQVA